MNLSSHGAIGPPPLGCLLHDWNVGAREGTDARMARRGLIIDLDDTLYAREEFVHSGLLAVARHAQEHRSVSAMEAFAVMIASRRSGAAGRELQALCTHFGWEQSDVPALLSVYRDHRPLLRLPRQSASVLSQVRADGWRIALLTNGPPRVQRAKVLALGLGAFVDAAVYADEHAPGGKPAAAAFRAALAALALPASRCVCAGDDASRDVAGARALGIKTVWVNPGFAMRDPGGVDGSEGAGADVTVASIGDLPLALADLVDTVKRDAA